MKAVATLLLVFVLKAACFHLPPEVPSCTKSDPEINECLRRSLEQGFHRLSTGDKHLGVVSYEPLHILEICAPENPEAAIKVSQRFFNIKIHGLSFTTVEKFLFDFDSCHAYVETITPLVQTEAGYQLKGHILIFPIDARGTSNITCTNLAVRHNVTCQRYSKRGKDYIYLTDYKITLQPESIRYTFENLFENTRLSEQVHKTINDRALAIFQEARAAAERAIAVVLHEIGNKIFNRIPITDIFK